MCVPLCLALVWFLIQDFTVLSRLAWILQCVLDWALFVILTLWSAGIIDIFHSVWFLGILSPVWLQAYCTMPCFYMVLGLELRALCMLATQAGGPGFGSPAPCKKPVMVVNACNPSSGEAHTGGSLGILGWPGSLAESVRPRFSKRPCLNKNQDGEQLKIISDLWYIYLHICACTHARLDSGDSDLIGPFVWRWFLS